MASEVVKTGEIEVTSKTVHTEEEKLKAAYALNLCTVSISQIVDYHDSYILEQEYDAILNNLNLKEMPKDEALLRILTEILNTITFFRIQELKKRQIEKKYNQRIKNAIWSAVPSLSVVVSGNPVAIALSLATQIGTGYMNYRKEKNNAKGDKDDAEVELEITAIEQLNSLKRELFTTAWRLADEYDFEDEWRITEKQIKQYNSILMDSNEMRKYVRLEAISDKFVAYPPFWYFYGHTANYISEMAKNRMSHNDRENDDDILAYCKDQAIVKRYSFLAKEHYEHYYRLCKNNILRQDQMTASFALEYLDLLLAENNKDTKKQIDLVRLAEKMSPTSFDILQLCVIAYLKIGKTDDAARLLKVLVNEDYNTSANAKLLSRIYVSKYLFGIKEESENAMADYQMLADMTDSIFLFPMPIKKPSDAHLEEKELQNQYLEEQKRILQKNYRVTILEFIKSEMIKYNRLWPVPYTVKNVDDKYYDYTFDASNQRFVDVKKVFDSEGKEEYIKALRDSSYRTHFLDLLNEMLRSLDELALFRYYEDKDYLVRKIRKQIVGKSKALVEYQKKLEKGDFSFDDYCNLVEELSFRTFTEEFFDELKTAIMNQIENVEIIAASFDKTPMNYLETAETDLIEFCHNHSLDDPDDIRKKRSGLIDISDCNYYFDYSILGNDIDVEVSRKEQRKRMQKTVHDDASSLCIGDSEEIAVLLPESDEFETYFKNENFGGAGIKSSVLVIIDDKTKHDQDLMLTYDGVVLVLKNKIQVIVDYKKIRYSKTGNKDKLILEWPTSYANKNINISSLYRLIEKVGEIHELL